VVDNRHELITITFAHEADLGKGDYISTFRLSSRSEINLRRLFLRWPVTPDSGFNSRCRHPILTLFSWVFEVAIMSMMDKPGEFDSDLKTAWMDEAKFRLREWYHVQDDGIWDTLVKPLVGKVRKSMR